MQERRWSICLLAIFMLGLNSKLVGEAYQPEFAEPLVNLTVPIGRDATFRCLVQNLGGYRVGWVKADTKAIQAIHVYVVTNNERVSVSHNGPTVWNLHIRNVQEEDRGQYMCQINTDPMQSQMGYLEVVIPPDFIFEETSSDVMVPEGGTVRISCRARGMPEPRIMWRREDGADIVLRDPHGGKTKEIIVRMIVEEKMMIEAKKIHVARDGTEDVVIRDPNGGKTKVAAFEEEILTLNKISRSDMGAYLCIASNGVPPSVSKRILVKVHFHPVIQVPNQLVGAPLGTDVTLECYVESSPKSINYWVRDSNEMVISSNKYEVENTVISSFESRMALTVRKLTVADVGGYRCVAKNSLGEVDSVIRLYEIPGPTIKNTSPMSKKEEQKYSTPIEGPDNQYGSAEKSDDEDDRESVTETDIYINRVQTNATRNKSNYSPTITIHEQKISNKVSKINNKIEIVDGELSTNNFAPSSVMLGYIPITLYFVVVVLLGFT